MIMTVVITIIMQDTTVPVQTYYGPIDFQEVETPRFCPKLVLFLTPLQFVHLFCNLSKCIQLFFSYISSLPLLFFWRHFL